MKLWKYNQNVDICDISSDSIPTYGKWVQNKCILYNCKEKIIIVNEKSVHLNSYYWPKITNKIILFSN
jgi:hypothetical protein